MSGSWITPPLYSYIVLSSDVPFAHANIYPLVKINWSEVNLLNLLILWPLFYVRLMDNPPLYSYIVLSSDVHFAHANIYPLVKINWDYCCDIHQDQLIYTDWGGMTYLCHRMNDFASNKGFFVKYFGVLWVTNKFFIIHSINKL